MSKKAFLRGFGTGVLFTALILGISCVIRTSDSAVVRRARELGMVYGPQEEEQSLVAGISTGGAAHRLEADRGEDTAPTKQPKGEKDSPSEPPSQEEEKKKAEREEKAAKQEIEREKQEAKKEVEDVMKEFSINSGDLSSSVSRRLEEMDLVDDAWKFDSYLEEMGYSERIRAGKYELPSDASYEEIARIITSN